MQDESEHRAAVQALLERAPRDISSEQLTDLFEEAFAVLWSRADRILGDVTLTAITDRVLFAAAERFPAAGLLEIEANGIRWSRLRERAPAFDRDQLAEALGFVLVEFLRVLGSLTAEILTPTLHRALAGVGPARRASEEGTDDQESTHARDRGEESKS